MTSPEKVLFGMGGINSASNFQYSGSLTKIMMIEKMLIEAP